MPIYEYFSPDLNKVYSFYARTLAEGQHTPRCPDGEQYPLQKRTSAFAITKSRSDEPTGITADEEAAFGALEREFADLDSENPDPRRLGEMMRRVSDLTGEPLTGSMEEMVHRLEKGEDPEALEEELGAMDDDEFGGMGEGGEPDSPFGEESLSSTDKLRYYLKKRKSQPIKDPQLYEMREWI